jgi:hypothetical protein
MSEPQGPPGNRRRRRNYGNSSEAANDIGAEGKAAEKDFPPTRAKEPEVKGRE